MRHTVGWLRVPSPSSAAPPAVLFPRPEPRGTRARLASRLATKQRRRKFRREGRTVKISWKQINGSHTHTYGRKDVLKRSGRVCV